MFSLGGIVKKPQILEKSRYNYIEKSHWKQKPKHFLLFLFKDAFLVARSNNWLKVKLIQSMQSGFLPLANEVCEGYVFTGVCVSTGGRAW